MFTNPHSPKMNALCERVIGTLRWECLDWVIPISEPHLRSLLKTWTLHSNRGRSPMSLGPRIPGPPAITFPKPATRHRRGESYSVWANPVLGGLHHEYCLVSA
jgi:hypothetical protein